MGSIPLPALHLNPPAPPPNMLEQASQLMQLRNMAQMAPLQQQAMQQNVQAGQLENQQRQIALKDQAAMTSAMQAWDGKDVNQLIPLVIKNGASAQAVMGLKAKVLEQQKTLSDIASADAATGSKNIETMKAKNDMIAGRLSTVLQMPDEQLPQAVTQAAQELSQQNLLDPQHAQSAAQLAQLPPQQIRSQLQMMEKGLMSQTQQIDAAAKAASTRASNAEANKNQAEVDSGTGPLADSRYRNVLMAQQLGRPVSPEDQAFKAAYEKQKTLVPVANFNLQNAGVGGSGNGQPSALAQAVANGQMKWGDVISPRTPMAVKQQFAKEVQAINPNFNSGDFNVEQKQKEAFTSGAYSQQLTAINTAREHMKTFTDLANALDNTDVQAVNKLGNAIGVQFGSDKATNFNIAKQAFASEVGKEIAGASVAEGDRQELAGQISAASSPAQLRGVAQTADKLLAGKQNALRQTFQNGQSGKPNFGDQGTGAPSSMTIKLPSGKTITID